MVRYFVAGITPEELARLPEELRPGRFVDGQDITNFALLTRLHNLQPHEQGLEPGLEARIANFFGSAAQRLAEVAPVAEEGRSA